LFYEGFLNTADGIVHGNMGLKDQLLALKWAKQNIKQFGGDPDQITIAGQSAGSAAVHFHILSPASNGFFRAAIMSSGTAIKPWSLVDDPKAQAVHLASQLKCPIVPGSEMVDCLRRSKAEDIENVVKNAIFVRILYPIFSRFPFKKSAFKMIN
jgi:carboxylesterase type B